MAYIGDLEWCHRSLTYTTAVCIVSIVLFLVDMISLKMFWLCPSIVRVVVSHKLCQHVSGNKLNRVFQTKYPTKCLIQPQILQDHNRAFRTSQCHRTPKLILLFIRPIAAALSGRVFRRWWQKKDEAERSKYSLWFKKNRSRFLAVIGLYFGSLVLYYFYNIEETPITKRKRFMAFTNDQLNDINTAASVSMTKSYQG